jgi:membrane-bound serine protease (ClpP class)
VVERFEMSTFRRILAQIADPNLALLFISIGTLAVIYEAANPGMGFAGIAGSSCCCSASSPQRAARHHRRHRTAHPGDGAVHRRDLRPGRRCVRGGGTIALILAGLFLFDGPVSVSMPVLWPTAVVLGAGSAYAGRAAVKARFDPRPTGRARWWAEKLRWSRDAGAGWSAFLDGTWWTVVRPVDDLRDGAQVAEVVAIDGLRLIVEAKESRR